MAQASIDPPIALVVEADDAVRNLASAVLEETDLNVVECSSAEAALSVLERPDANVALLFSEMSLSGEMDGAALARTVAKRWPEVRTVVTSRNVGQAGGSLPQRAVFMQKPWRALDVLVQAERASLDASRD